MGIHISITTPDNKEHPDWDFFRHAGDREIPAILASVPLEYKNIGTEYEPDYLVRPTDYAAFREAVSTLPYNRDRWEKMATILEADRSYWLYLGF